MGAVGSKDFREVLNEEFPGTSTPPCKRQLGTQFDPRSPSNGIERTPIQVEKTPDFSLVDPRSPTVGIFRTPIQAEKPADTMFDPRSPSVGINRTPIYEKPKLDLSQAIDSTEIQAPSVSSPLEEGPASVCAKAKSPDMQTSLRLQIEKDTSLLEDSMELMAKASSGSEAEDNTQLIKTPEQKSAKKKILKTPTKEPSLRLRKPKALFPTHTNTEVESQLSPKVKDGPQRSPLRLIGDSQRSPLNRKATKDVNSPRAIVQRKQATKLEMIKSQCSVQVRQSPQKYQVFHDDKENNTADF